MKSLVIIESPFQLLSAIEAQNNFKIDDLIIVIKYTNNPKTNNQIDWILSKNSFKKIIKLPKFKKISINDYLLAFLIFIWKIRKASFNYIFVGEPRSVIMKCFILNLKHNNYYLLDDGSSTIIIQNQIIKDNDSSILNQHLSKGMTFRKIFFKILGLKYNFNISANFFTCFNLKSIENQDILKHNFYHIQEIGKKDSLDNTVYFIGGNLSEIEAIDQEKEVYLISKIAEYYKIKGLKIIYCCHRRESKIKLDKISNISNISKLYFPEYPLELEFIIKNISAKHISSFCSTALYTSTLIFKPDSSVMFKIPVEYIYEPYLIEFEGLEQNFVENSMIILEENYL